MCLVRKQGGHSPPLGPAEFLHFKVLLVGKNQAREDPEIAGNLGKTVCMQCTHSNLLSHEIPDEHLRRLAVQDAWEEIHDHEERNCRWCMLLPRREFSLKRGLVSRQEEVRGAICE